MNYLRVFVAAGSLTLAASGFAETVHGVLTTIGGKPISGAVLHGSGFVRNSYGQWKDFRFTARSGPNGSFQLAGIPSKPTAQAPVELVALLPNGHLTNVNLSADNEIVKVVDHTVRLRVHVVNAGGAPVKGAQVITERVYGTWASQKDPAVIYMGALDEIASRLTAQTDDQGVAIIDGLPAGEHAAYRVHASGMVRFSKIVELPKDGESTLDAALTSGVILTGKVLSAGKPASGVKVIAWVLGPQMYTGFQTTTGPNGDYRIDDAPSGETHIDADPGKQYPDLVAKTISDLKLAEGAELDGLNFVLEKGVLIQGQVRTVSSDIPVAGASVTIQPEGGIAAYLKTDAKGRFAATVLAGDEYVSVDEVDNRRIRTGPNIRVNVDARHNPPLDLHVADVLVLPAIPHLTGTAVDAAGSPVSGATVRDIDTRTTAMTDEKGQFQFSEETHPGDLIIVTKGNAASKEAIVLAGNTKIALRLDSKTAAVEGIVVGDDGKPIPGVELSLGGKGAVGNTHVTSDPNGRYSFDGLVCGLGDFNLWSKKAGYGDETIQLIAVSPAETKALQPMRLVLADGVIDGKVLGPDGKPAVGIKVSAQSRTSEPVLTDAQGTFHLSNVPRGEHTLEAGRGYTIGASTRAKTGQTDVVLRLTPEKVAPGVVRQELPGKTAPVLKTAGWVNGKPIDLGSLKGKIVVVDFWAIHCAPCVAALPKVQALADEYGKQGVVVVGVHETGTTMAKLKAFGKQKGLTYPIALDLADKSGLGASASLYQPKGWPTVYVIAPSGRIISESNAIEDAVKAVQKLLAKGN